MKRPMIAIIDLAEAVRDSLMGDMFGDDINSDDLAQLTTLHSEIAAWIEGFFAAYQIDR